MVHNIDKNYPKSIVSRKVAKNAKKNNSMGCSPLRGVSSWREIEIFYKSVGIVRRRL